MQVHNEWLKDPETSGDVLVNGLSLGEHYFACSVGDHCLRGMRLTVRVESGGAPLTPAQVRHQTNLIPMLWSLLGCR
jgi:hypothetical protein